jgi:hypothetical protein
MIPNQHPTTMSSGERMQEIASILATGYSRLLLSRQKALAASARAEALCDHPVNGDGAAPGRRSA